jgi:Sulfotransferase family
MRELQVIFILGDGYSGSTLLDLILGSHSDLMGLGEIDANSFDRFLDQNQLCTCLFSQRQCHFWARVLAHLATQPTAHPFRLKYPQDDLNTITKNTLALLYAIQAVSGKNMLVDSSKRWPRAAALIASGEIQAKVIHLLRNGRGVAFSHLKRGEPFEAAVQFWQTTNLEIQQWLADNPQIPQITLKYEDLCAAPVMIMQQICQFLAIDWQPQMMHFADQKHHNVGGNTMRLLLKNSAIKLDEEWRQRLTDSELALFETLAGETAKKLGY